MQIEIDSLPNDVKAWFNSTKENETLVFTEQGKTIAHISIDKEQMIENVKTDINEGQETAETLYQLFANYELDCVADIDLIEIR